MTLLLAGFIVAFVIALPVQYGLRGCAGRLGLIDRPDGERKTHEDPTALTGGIGIFLAAVIATGCLTLALGDLPWASFEGGSRLVFVIAAAATAIMVLGIVDDRIGLSAWTKFAVEIGIALALVWSGVRIDVFGVGGQGFDLPTLVAVPLSVFWIVGITNSFNLLDGSDGVAGGAALFALLTMGGVSLLYDQSAVAGVSFVLAGATLGFLFFNFPPATVFLGDGGSLLLGFSLASMGLVATQKAPTVLAVAVPLAAFGLPVMDTSLAIIRRFLRRERIFAPDRGHIHHRLKDLGHSPRKVALVLYMLTAAFCMFSLLVAGGQAALTAVGFLVIGVVVVLFIQRLRVPELMELARIVNRGRAQRVAIERNVRVQKVAAGLQEAGVAGCAVSALRSALGESEFFRCELWVHKSMSGGLLDRPEVRVEGDGALVTLDLAAAAPSIPSVELRFALSLPDGTRIGRCSLTRPVEADAVSTDLNLISQALLPAIARTLRRQTVASGGDRSSARGRAASDSLASA